MSLTLRASRRVLVLAATVLAAAGALVGPAASPAAAVGVGMRYAVNRSLCAEPTDPGTFRCFALARVPAAADTPGAYRVQQVGHGPRGGYSPADLAKAYGYNAYASVSQTVAIVDWYDDPNIAKDLAAFDRTYRLPAETARSFRKVNQNGASSPLPARSRDVTETALDVEAVRAVCHKCRILLVEARSPTSANLAAAENTAVRLGANEVSNSFGGVESTVSTAMISAFRHPGVVITASTGDEGWMGWDYVNSRIWPDGAASFPASDPYVVAVGGTHLTVNANGTRSSETVWNDNGANDSVGVSKGSMGATGGGCSRRFPAGSWQWHVPGYGAMRCGSAAHNRVAADVSAVADPHTGFDVRDTYGHNGWLTVGGTSLSAPIVAAMYALAGGSGGSAYPAASLYVNTAQHPQARWDVLQGGNSFCGGEHVLQNCMNAVAHRSGSASNNPNSIVDAADPMDCSFTRSGASAAVAPSPDPQCNAAAGYDGPSGLGTPVGLSLFRPTSGYGTLNVPSLPRLHRSQTYAAVMHERITGARFVSYLWSWGDGSRSATTTTPSAAHDFTRAGRHTVTITVNDSLHQVVVRQRAITVGVGPVVHYSGPKLLHRGRHGSFSAAGSRSANTGAHVSSVVWRWGDGHTSKATHPSHAYARDGKYTVTLTIKDNTGATRSVRHTVEVTG